MFGKDEDCERYPELLCVGLKAVYENQKKY